MVQSLEPAHQDFTRKKPLNNDPEPEKTDVLEIKSKVTKALEEQMMKLQGHQASTIMTKGAELMQKKNLQPYQGKVKTIKNSSNSKPHQTERIGKDSKLNIAVTNE